MQISNGPINLNLVVDGDADAPPVLFLHGITMSTATWEFVVPSLAERYRLWRLDFRGHGDSDRAPDSYTPAGYVSDAVAAIESGVGQPCVVVGHSLGGLVAAALAQQRPDLVRAVLLEDPALFDTGTGSENAAEALEGNALLDLFRLIYEAIPEVQEAGIAEAELAGMLAAGPSASGPRPKSSTTPTPSTVGLGVSCDSTSRSSNRLFPRQRSMHPCLRPAGSTLLCRSRRRGWHWPVTPRLPTRC